MMYNLMKNFIMHNLDEKFTTRLDLRFQS